MPIEHVNPLIEIVELTGKPAYVLLENELKNVVSSTTFYNLLEDRGIPAKSQWGTINRVATALGYDVTFVKANHK